MNEEKGEERFTGLEKNVIEIFTAILSSLNISLRQTDFMMNSGGFFYFHPSIKNSRNVYSSDDSI